MASGLFLILIFSILVGCIFVAIKKSKVREKIKREKENDYLLNSSYVPERRLKSSMAKSSQFVFNRNQQASETSYETEEYLISEADNDKAPRSVVSGAHTNTPSKARSRVITRGGKLSEYVEKIKEAKKMGYQDEGNFISPPAQKRYPVTETQSLKENNYEQIQGIQEPLTRASEEIAPKSWSEPTSIH